MKYKFFLILLIITTYIIVLSTYCLYFEENEVIYVLYNNIFTFMALIIIYLFFITKKRLVAFEMIRYNCFKDYFKKLSLDFLLFNVVTMVSLAIANMIIANILKSNVNIYFIIFNSIHLFLIFEIIDFAMISMIFKRNFVFISFLMSTVIFLLYTFNLIGFEIPSIFNIFNFLNTHNNLMNMLIHYILWFYISYLLINKNWKKVEL